MEGKVQRAIEQQARIDRLVFGNYLITIYDTISHRHYLVSMQYHFYQVSALQVLTRFHYILLLSPVLAAISLMGKQRIVMTSFSDGVWRKWTEQSAWGWHKELNKAQFYPQYQ